MSDTVGSVPLCEVSMDLKSIRLDFGCQLYEETIVKVFIIRRFIVDPSVMDVTLSCDGQVDGFYVRAGQECTRDHLVCVEGRVGLGISWTSHKCLSWYSRTSL